MTMYSSADINECLVKKGGCQDVCVNAVGSFRCLCTHVGQVLSEDGLTCKGKQADVSRGQVAMTVI